MASLKQIAKQLPDIPRWVEIRDLLRAEDGKVYGYENQPDLAFVLHSLDDEETMYIVGSPSLRMIEESLARLKFSGTIITTLDQSPCLIEHFPIWTHERIFVYTLSTLHPVPHHLDADIGFLDPTLLEGFELPEDLAEELEDASEYSRIAAVFVGKQPVSFCYVASETETLWDVSIDTLADYRRKGYAGVCFAYLAQYMQTQGKSPVWQSLESNEASWKLALKLGFEQVDELMIFYVEGETQRIEA